jgi:hypothetical protein
MDINSHRIKDGLRGSSETYLDESTTKSDKIHPKQPFLDYGPVEPS